MSARITIAPLIDYITRPDLADVSPVTQLAMRILTSMGLPVNLLWFLCGFLAFQILKSSLNTFAYHLILRTKYAVLHGVMMDAFEDFYGARWSFFSGSEQGTLLNTFVREIQYIGDSVAAILRLISHCLQVSLYLAVPLYLSWQVTGISIGLGLLAAGPFLLLGRLSYRLGRLNTLTANAWISTIQDCLGLSKVILGFGNQLKCLEKISRVFQAHRQVTVKSQTLQVAVTHMYEPLGLLIIATALMVGQRMEIRLSELVVILWAFRSTIPLVSSILSERNLVIGFLPSYEQLTRFGERARELSERTGGSPFKGFRRDIAVEGLTFAYPGNEPVLKDVSLLIPKGTMVAVVGASGVGKSTLIDMLMGLDEPQMLEWRNW